MMEDNPTTVEMSMPTPSSLRQKISAESKMGETTVQIERDYTVTKTEGTPNTYSVEYHTYKMNGVDMLATSKSEMEAAFVASYKDESWDAETIAFSASFTVNKDGTVAFVRGEESASGTYVIDRENSKITVTVNEDGEEAVVEAKYSNDGKNIVLVGLDSDEHGTTTSTMTFTRK